MITSPEINFRTLTSVSPSFTTNSSNNLADIAARVVEEFRIENRHDDDDIDIFNDDVTHVAIDDESEANYEHKSDEEEEEEEEEFAFDVICTQNNSSSVSHDEIFFNGEIVGQYPLFDRSLLLDDVADSKSCAVRHSLRHLFIEERETASCSSSEADELDGLTPAENSMYCIWKPKVQSVETCKKSNSTGNSSKRWKFSNLLHRSKSDGKQDQVGVFANVNGLSRKLHPF